MKTVNQLADIPPECYGVVSLDSRTGTPLNEDGSWCTENEGFFRLFNSEEDATVYCLSKLAGSPLSEWLIVDGSGAQISRFANDEQIVEAKKNKESRKSWFRRLIE